jgi:hypothetical protein
MDYPLSPGCSLTSEIKLCNQFHKPFHATEYKLSTMRELACSGSASSSIPLLPKKENDLGECAVESFTPSTFPYTGHIGLPPSGSSPTCEATESDKQPVAPEKFTGEKIKVQLLCKIIFVLNNLAICLTFSASPPKSLLSLGLKGMPEQPLISPQQAMRQILRMQLKVACFQFDERAHSFKPYFDEAKVFDTTTTRWLDGLYYGLYWRF